MNDVVANGYAEQVPPGELCLASPKVHSSASFQSPLELVSTYQCSHKSRSQMESAPIGCNAYHCHQACNILFYLFFDTAGF